MAFLRQCGCVKHNEWSEGKSFSLKTLSQRPFKADIISFLKAQSLLPDRVKYLCDSCVSFANTLYQEPSTSKKPTLRSVHVQDVISDIEAGKVCEQDLITLTQTIGSSQCASFREYSEDKTSSYRSNLHNVDFPSYLQGVNILLLTFLTSITGISIDECKKKCKRTIALCAAIDCLLSVCNTNAITPLFFIINLTCYFITGSKAICNLLSSCTPSGSYTLIKSWFSSITEKPLLNRITNGADFVSYFDNSQILSRNWRVRYQAKALISVITSVIHIVPKKASSIQFIEELSPKHWLYKKTVVDIDRCLYSYNDTFSSCRDEFIQSVLNSVIDERSVCPDIVDNVDYVVEKSNTNRNLYDFVPNVHPASPPDVYVGEPCLVNPCSYDAVRKVLEQLSSRENIDDRKWTIVGCDGSPYILASRIIQKSEDLQHILLQPGLGHVEINVTKGVFKLLWDVCLSDIARMLGFHSLKAQTAMKNAGDHHKAWQILTILLHGTAKELLVPFVDHCKVEDEMPTLEKYYTWLKTVKNPSYIFLQEVIFTYVYSIFLFRAGVRRNNSVILNAARQKFSPLFFGLNQTHYQELEYRDYVIRSEAPQEVSQFITENESFSMSGDSSKGEGGDFVLESYNRRLKMMMPPGLATEDRWLKICRGYDEVHKIRHNLNESLGTEEKKDAAYVYHASMEKEILHWRKRIRSRGYFSHPEEEEQHVSITGEKLDPDLVHFSEHCKGNKMMYLEAINSGLEPGKGEKLTPIFVTPEEREKFRNIENKTIKDIQGLIDVDITLIADIGFDDEAVNLRQTFTKKVKASTKAVHIAFYRGEVSATLEECLHKKSVDDCERSTQQ